MFKKNTIIQITVSHIIENPNLKLQCMVKFGPEIYSISTQFLNICWHAFYTEITNTYKFSYPDPPKQLKISKNQKRYDD